MTWRGLNTATNEQSESIQLSAKEAQERAGRDDLVFASQIFQNRYQPPFVLTEVRRFSVDVDGMARAEESFEREMDRLLQAIGGA